MKEIPKLPKGKKLGAVFIRAFHYDDARTIEALRRNEPHMREAFEEAKKLASRQARMYPKT